MILGSSQFVTHVPTKLRFVAGMLLAVAAVGCGRTDLGNVRGRVVSNGEARGFQPPENMRITFTIEDSDIPRTYAAAVQADGTFSIDMNDGSGRGIPNGTYAVAIDTNGLLMRAPGAVPSVEQTEGNEYPRPAPEIVQKLKKATCRIEVTRRSVVNLTVDLSDGTITQ